MSAIPIARSVALAGGTAVGFQEKNRELTQRGKVHQTGENDEPMVHGVNHIATVKLRVYIK